MGESRFGQVDKGPQPVGLRIDARFSRFQVGSENVTFHLGAMNILMVCKYPPIQGGVSAETYWTANALAELGHSVCVLTNANEVESAYRITLTSEDERLLLGYRKRNAIRVISTQMDPMHVYVPQNNPSVSKLISKGIEIISEWRPDFIFGWYLEPYGVAALFLSSQTGVPFIIRHAGSDIGRLMPTPQLSALYSVVLRKASVVLTSPYHHSYFKSVGVAEENLVRPVFTRLPGDIFYPTDKTFEGDELTVGIYGKAGRSKGTFQAASAVRQLHNEGIKIRLEAHWGGRDLERFRCEFEGAGISEAYLAVRPFIPHWAIPAFIRRCHMVLFLEHNFRIPFHTPGIPYEVWACGTHLVTTEEIAQKPHIVPYIDSRNTTLIRGGVTTESVADAIRTALSEASEGEDRPAAFDAALASLKTREEMQRLLRDIQARV